MLGYERVHGVQRDAVLLNLSDENQRVALVEGDDARVLLSTHPGRFGGRFGARLDPNEAVVLALSDEPDE